MLSIPYRWFFYFYIEQAEVREETFFESTLPGALKAKSNGNDRRQWRKQGVAVGAAACKMRVPSKARSRCREPQPEYISGKFFDIADQPGLRAWLICFFTKGAGKETSICLRWFSAGAAVWKEEADIKWSQSRSPRLQFAAGGFCFSMKRGSS